MDGEGGREGGNDPRELLPCYRSRSPPPSRRDNLRGETASASVSTVYESIDQTGRAWSHWLRQLAVYYFNFPVDDEWRLLTAADNSIFYRVLLTTTTTTSSSPDNETIRRFSRRQHESYTYTPIAYKPAAVTHKTKTDEIRKVWGYEHYKMKNILHLLLRSQSVSREMTISIFVLIIIHQFFRQAIGQ